MREAIPREKLVGADFFQAAQLLDSYEVLCLWFATAGIFIFWWNGADLDVLRIVLWSLTICLAAIECCSFYKDERYLWRARTFVLVGMYSYILLSPILSSFKHYRASGEGIYTAMTAVMLYFSTYMTTYSMSGRVMRRHVKILNPVTVEFSKELALKILLICFLPTIAMRALLQDWSRVSSIASGLLGLESQPWRHTGFGDWKAVLMPLGWLFHLVPILSGACWIKFKRWPVGQWVVILIWAFLLPSLMLQRSRALLFMTVAMVFMLIILSEHENAARKRMYILFLLLIPLLTILANLILIDRGGGVVMQQIVRDEGVGAFDLNADPRTLTEDNLYYFANTADVVPRQVAHRSPFELYYYMAINPVPRFLWPSKPWMSQAYLGKIRPYYAAVTIIGDLYIYGGWLHILLFAMLFGCAIRFVDEFVMAEDTPATGTLLLFASSTVLLFSTIRALWNLIVGSYAVITLGVGLYVLGRLNRSRTPT